MEKINFNDLPNTDTPINSSNLNQLQTNVESAINEIGESGSWTPSIGADGETFPTVTYGNRRGLYKKIGKMVYVEFYVDGKITALNGTNNYAIVNGLPFSVHSNSYFGQSCLHLGSLYNIVENPDAITLILNGNKVRIQTFFGASGGKLITSGTKNFLISGSGWYMID